MIFQPSFQHSRNSIYPSKATNLNEYAGWGIRNSPFFDKDAINFS